MRGVRAAVAWIGIVTYAMIVVAVTLSPTPLDADYGAAISKFLGVLHRHGVPEWFGYSKLEFGANIVMFLPLGFLFTMALPRRARWLGWVLLPLFSVFVEWAQGQFLSARFSSFADVIANTLGAWLGIAGALIILTLVELRDRRVIHDAFQRANASAREYEGMPSR